MSDPEFIDPDQSQLGPVRHQSLPPDMLEQIQSIYEVLGRYFNLSLDEFEIDFRRDESPEIEVDLWMGITAAWIAYHEQHLNDELLPESEERKLLSALIAISTGIDDAAKLGVPVDVGLRLLECYLELDGDGDSDEDE